MPAFLVQLLAWALGSGLARILFGAGLAVVSYTALSAVVNVALDEIASHMSGLPGDLAAILSISGIGAAMASIGTAMLIRVAIESSKLGLKKAAS